MLSTLVKQLLPIVSSFLFVCVLSLVPTAAVYLDLVVLEQKTNEKSVTEITQGVFLLITAVGFWSLGLSRKQQGRGAYLLIAGFFSCALIRELDAVFDLVWKGFWVVPACAMALGCIGYVVLRANEKVPEELIRIARLPEMNFIIFGLVTLLVFSRTFGSGSLIWHDVLRSGNSTLFKSALQEGLELYGYIFILYGSLKLRFLISGRKWIGG